MFPSYVIDGLKAGTYRKIAILSGAGSSVSSGIPDFRSPGGFYDSLRPELITATAQQRRAMAAEPSMVVDIGLFSVNQFPYLEVRRPFILGTIARQWKPTLTHVFYKLLYEKSLLQRLYTQNIDGLDHHVGIPAEKIVDVHGTISSMSCESCKTPYPTDEFKVDVETKIRNIYDSTDSSAPNKSSNIFC